MFEDRLDWIGGLYYYTEEGRSDDFIDFLSLDLQSGGKFETESYAVFGQGSYHFTDQLTLTVGLRYTDEEKISIIDGVQHQVVTALLFSGDAFKTPLDPPLQVVAPGKFVDDLTETDPYFNLSYQWSDDLMTYISYSEGFKGGGVQVRNGNIKELPRFGPEFAEVAEIGVKWTLMDGRMNISSAAFTTDYSDLQITATILEPVPTSVVKNAGDAEIKGFELEVVLLPIPRLNIVAGLSYLDAEYTSLIPGAIEAGILESNDLPNVPEWQANVSISYDLQTSNGTFIPRVDYSYSDEQFNDANNNEAIKRDSTDILNLSLGYLSVDELWSGSVFVTNALDERVVLAGFDGGFYADGAISRPREWGLRIRRSF